MELHRRSCLRPHSDHSRRAGALGHRAALDSILRTGDAAPWSFDDATTFARRMLAQIVGFRIEIERIEGKWKLNQNHPVERRKKVIAALLQQGDENSRSIAATMQQTLAAEETRHDDQLPT